jgi:hypothetical protein
MRHPARQTFLDNLGTKLAGHLLWPAPAKPLSAAIIKIAPAVGITIDQNAHRSGSKAAKGISAVCTQIRASRKDGSVAAMAWFPGAVIF